MKKLFGEITMYSEDKGKSLNLFSLISYHFIIVNNFLTNLCTGWLQKYPQL